MKSLSPVTYGNQARIEQGNVSADYLALVIFGEPPNLKNTDTGRLYSSAPYYITDF
jgi:hypothetical protein